MTMANSTVLQLVFTGFAIVLCTVLLLVKYVKKNSTKLYKPVMEMGRDKGELVLGNYDTTEPVMEEGRERGKLVLNKDDISDYLLQEVWNGPH